MQENAESLIVLKNKIAILETRIKHLELIYAETEKFNTKTEKRLLHLLVLQVLLIILLIVGLFV